ncbi:MAG: N-acetylgalactosamine 6-sulfate sulfatase, partial [Candidatus Tectomicrobia bacterium]|nr:N-acetylgalactosamine 6-sulfate sulfatase [Candidatus Tectomicrobia bacterium]
DSERKWIMALGHGGATLDEKGVRGVKDFATRVIRDKRYKVWVSDQRQIIRLHDLIEDPWEENNLISSDRAEYKKAVGKFQKVVDSLPEKDARPLYEPRAANPWDRKLK